MNDRANVLITGSSSGFGILTAKTLLSQGHTVYGTMREPLGRNAPAAQDLQGAAADTGGKLVVLDMDVTEESSVNGAVSQMLESEGAIDVVVNNAGVGAGGFAEAFTPEQYAAIFDVNVVGVQRVNRAVLPSMRDAGKGLLIHISSVMGRIVLPFSAPYTASKYALEGMIETYAYELMGTGVDVSLIEPGGFGTNFADRMLSPGDPTRVEGYGDRANLPEQMWGGFLEQLKDGPDPQAVPDAIVSVMDASPGQRPLRVVVDPMMGGEAPKAINAMTDKIQGELLSNLGMA